MEQLIKDAWSFAEIQLKNEYSGHDIQHIKRVYRIGESILKKAKCNHLAVKLAIILHDVDDYKVTKIKTDDCIRAREYLNTTNLDNETIEHICYIINNMSFSKKDKKELSYEGMIVQDADRIDALGAVGIARTFQFGGQNNREMYNSFEHFDEKLIKLYDMLNTKEAKEIALPRHEFLMSFYNQFKIEWE